jgi:hypothetical protein
VFNKKYVNLDASLSSYIYKGVDFIDCSNRDYSDIKATLNACVYAFNHSAKAGPLSSQELDFLTRLSSNGCGKIIVVVTNFESCSPTDLPLLLKGIRLQVKDIDVTNVQVVPVSSDFHFSGLEMGVSTLIDRSGIAKLKSIIKTSLIDVRNDRKARLVLSREKLKHAGALVYADLDKHVA